MARKVKTPRPAKKVNKTKTAKAAQTYVGRKAEVIAMFKRPGGATAAQIVKQTGMLRHSARALVSQLGIKVKKAKNATTGDLVYSA